MTITLNPFQDKKLQVITTKDKVIFFALACAGIFTHLFSLYVFFVPISGLILFLLVFYYVIRGSYGKISGYTLCAIGKFLFFSYATFGIWGYFNTMSGYSGTISVSENYSLLFFFVVLLSTGWFVIKNFQFVFFFRKYTNETRYHFQKNAWFVAFVFTFLSFILVLIPRIAPQITMNTQKAEDQTETTIKNEVGNSQIKETSTQHSTVEVQ